MKQRQAWLPTLMLSALLLVSCKAQQGAVETAGEMDEPSPAREVSAATTDQPTDVVFVCQYGYAKSLVSRLHFERLAAERGLPVRAIARGVTPSDGVPEPLAAALRDDGFEVGPFQPSAVTAEEIDAAEYVVAFGNEVPETAKASTLDWGAVSALSENYAQARDEIVAHVTMLLDDIEASSTAAADR